MKKKNKAHVDGSDAASSADDSTATDVASLVSIETIKPGDSRDVPVKGDLCTVHYIGSLKDGEEVFDSSRAKGEAFAFTVGKGQVIRGWEVALPQMTLGQRAKVTIAAEAGYGAAGCVSAEARGTGKIPPNADLVFDIELLDINGRRSLSRCERRCFGPPAWRKRQRKRRRGRHRDWRCGTARERPHP